MKKLKFILALLILGSISWASGLQTLAEKQAGWTEGFNRAEEAINASFQDNELLIEIRKRLVEIRGEATSIITALDTEMTDLASQIFIESNSLSSENPLPTKDDNVQEVINVLTPSIAEVGGPNAITKARSELEAEYAELEKALQAAKFAKNRAESLISNIDSLRSKNALDALRTRQSNILSPQVWIDAPQDIEASVTKIIDNFVRRLENPTTQKKILDSLPLDILLIIIALSLVILSPKMIERQLYNMQSSESRFMRAFANLIEKTYFIIIPLIAVWIIDRALSNAILNGLNFIALRELLRTFAIAFIIANWLSKMLNIDAPKRFMFGTFIVLITNEISVFGTTNAWSPNTQGVVLFISIILTIFSFYTYRNEENFNKLLGNLNLTIFKPILPFLRIILIAAIMLSLIFVSFGYMALAYSIFVPIMMSFISLLIIITAYNLLLHFVSEVFGIDANEEAFSFWPIILGMIALFVFLTNIAIILGIDKSIILDGWARLLEGLEIGNIHISPSNILSMLLVFTIGYLLVGGGQSGLRRVILPRTKLDNGAQSAIVALFGYAGYTLAAFIALSASGIDLSSIAVVLGALSVGIGFGLQNIVSNFVSGIILLIERPIKRGDWIAVGEHTGYVKKIAVRSTEIETFDDASVIIPNADLLNSAVVNWMHSSDSARVRLPIGVSYDTDPDEVIKILLEVADENEYKTTKVYPARAYLMGFGPSSLDFELRFYVAFADDIMLATSSANIAILKKLREANIEIPFPQQDIHIRSEA